MARVRLKRGRDGKIKVRSRSGRNPKRGRKNPDGSEAAAAADLFESFHGKPATRTREVAEPREAPTDLADLGRLIQLVVWLDEDNAAELNFSGNIRTASTGDGGSLYFVGGVQRLDLEALDRAAGLPKDHVVIGPVQSIVYHTTKDFHDFEPVDYIHDFGEETGVLPILNYDTRNERLYLTGGEYQVRREGIVN